MDQDGSKAPKKVGRLECQKVGRGPLWKDLGISEHESITHFVFGGYTLILAISKWTVEYLQDNSELLMDLPCWLWSQTMAPLWSHSDVYPQPQLSSLKAQKSCKLQQPFRNAPGSWLPLFRSSWQLSP